MVEALHRILRRVRSCASAVWRKLAPFAEVSPTLVDAVRSRRELLVENALLRHQIVVLRRRVPRPRLTRVDRLRPLLAACLLPGWRRAVALVQPQTILRWHRLGFRLFWRHKSKSCPRDQVTSDTVGLIQEMAARNRLLSLSRESDGERTLGGHGLRGEGVAPLEQGDDDRDVSHRSSA